MDAIRAKGPSSYGDETHSHDQIKNLSEVSEHRTVPGTVARTGDEEAISAGTGRIASTHGDSKKRERRDSNPRPPA